VTSETTQGRILDAAEQLLGRLGYQKMTMDDIAAEARVSRRTIYLHFDSKESVALATIDRIVEQLLVRLREHASADAPWDERLRRMLLERVLFRFDSVRGYYHSIDEIFRSVRPVDMERRERYFAQEAEVFASVLAGASGCAVSVRRRSELWAESLLLATNALLPSALSPRELGQRAHVEARVSRIAELVIGGLARAPAARSRRAPHRPRARLAR
jgi:AcrR family transcriptional regulator